MKKTTKLAKKRKGAALIVAILLASIIGSAAIGVTALAFRQVNIAETYNNGLVAFYSAESGLEQGLLYNKYDKNVEIPETILTTFLPDSNNLKRRPANAYRNFMADNSSIMRTPLHSPVTPDDKKGLTVGYLAGDRNQVYDLQSFYKQAYVGSDLTAPIGVIDEKDLTKPEYNDPTYKIAKDNAESFTINSTGAIHLYWKWVKNDPLHGDCNGSPRALEVKVKVNEASPISGKNEYTALFRDKRCGGLANSQDATEVSGTSGKYTVFTTSTNNLLSDMGISAFTPKEISLKPVGNTAASGDGIYFGYFQEPVSTRNSSGASTTIESIGYFAGNSRQITANIDRQTGTILDIFNYVVYKGQ